MRSKTLKTLTIFGFCVLLAGFIAFKAGIFDRYLEKDTDLTVPQNEGKTNPDLMPMDSSPIKKPQTIRENPAMLSTSKSLILLDQKLEFPIIDSLKFDSINRKRKNY